MNVKHGMQVLESLEIQTKWAPVIEKHTDYSTDNKEDKDRIKWMSKLMHVVEDHEQINGGGNLIVENNATATLGSISGMGAVTSPGSPLSQGRFGSQAAGSGDKPNTVMPLNMQVAAQTVGFDLVPTVQSPGPFAILTYFDGQYAGGVMAGTGDDVPLLIRVALAGTTAAKAFVKGATGYLMTNATTAGNTALATFVGTSRVSGEYIFKIDTIVSTLSISDVLVTSGVEDATIADGVTVHATAALPNLVSIGEDHVTGFSGASYSRPEPYSRDEGESTRDNMINFRVFNKTIEMKTFQVAAGVTREQLQDMKQFGLDLLGQVKAFLANEVTQSINKNILDRMRRLGSTNHWNIYNNDGIHFHLNIGPTAQTLGQLGFTEASFYAQATDGSNADVATFPTSLSLGATEPDAGTSAENLHTRQRKIYSKMLAAANMIAVRGRRGRANFAVTNGNVVSALQDVAGFVPVPMSNTISQDSGSLYPVGAIGGIAIYCDPNMAWNDDVITLGRKGDGNSPGLVMFTYLLADTVEAIAEGTMAPKVAIKSRYNLVEAGWHPETMYITFGVGTQFDALV